LARKRTERRLVAILAADVAGYSGLVAADEEGVLAQFSAHMHELVEPKVAEHRGRIVKRMGDGLLIEYASAVDALQCAIDLQDGMRERNARAPGDRRMEFRVGIHTADVVVEGDDIFGDGVNVASRLEGVADPGGICVSGRVMEDSQGRLEVSFEDGGDQRLKNIPREVRIYRVRTAAAVSGVVRAGSPPLPSKPSIAVLPFLNMSGDAEQEYFADAITEDLTTALSRWRWFFVIARNSAFAYKGRAVDVKRVGLDLGVRYLLEGSVRKVGSRVRITAQLLDAADATHIWADRFDRDLVDILALQDEITELVVAAIEPAMLNREGVRAARKDLKDFTALDCFQRGMWHLNQVSREGYLKALDLFRQAIARDPDLALGHIGLSRILYGGATVFGWSEHPDPDLEESRQAALTAISLDATDSVAHFALAGAALYLARHEEALDAAYRSIALNPNFAFGYHRLGQVLTYVGRPAEAIEPIERGLRHNPFDPQLGALLATLALAHYQAKNYVEAVARAKAATQHGFIMGYALLAASLARLGRPEDARRAFTPEVRERLLRDAPRLAPYLHDLDRYHLWEGLLMADSGVSAPVPAG
jgi:TolB-like protein